MFVPATGDYSWYIDGHVDCSTGRTTQNPEDPLYLNSRSQKPKRRFDTLPPSVRYKLELVLLHSNSDGWECPRVRCLADPIQTLPASGRLGSSLFLVTAQSDPDGVLLPLSNLFIVISILI